MPRYMCLVSGEVFENEDEAAGHTQGTHRLSFDDALNRNDILVTLGEEEDPEARYKHEVERR
jgi:hypothetical protein